MNLYPTDTPNFENVPTSELEDFAKSLISKKIDIESQMDGIVARLNSDDLSRIGLKRRLTDDEGFPLSGIDIHEVRTLRNRFATLSTDLYLILHEIEKSIHDIHEQARITGRVQPGVRGRRIPFGRIETVVPGSPADDGGLLVGDRIVKFGNLSTISDSGVQNCYDGIPEAIRGVSGSEYLDVEILRLGREEDDIIVRIHPRDGYSIRTHMPSVELSASLPPFFPLTRPGCEEAASQFFTCLTDKSEPRGDSPSGKAAVQACDALGQVYSKCIRESLQAKGAKKPISLTEWEKE